MKSKKSIPFLLLVYVCIFILKNTEVGKWKNWLNQEILILSSTDFVFV
jgi:hypothetical protein